MFNMMFYIRVERTPKGLKT